MTLETSPEVEALLERFPDDNARALARAIYWHGRADGTIKTTTTISRVMFGDQLEADHAKHRTPASDLLRIVRWSTSSETTF